MKREKADTYGWFDNLRFHIKATKDWDKKLFYYQFLPVLPNVAGTFLSLLLPAELVRGLEQRWDILWLAGYLFLLSAGILLCQLADQGMSVYLYRNAGTVMLYYEQRCDQKIMGLDYGQLEEPDCRKLIGNVWNVLRNEYGVRESICGVPKILGGLLGVLWYGSLIGQKNGLILLLAAGNTLLSIGLMSAVRKKHAALHEQIGVYARETAYISRQSMDRRAGKDIRMYRMADWFLKKYDQSLAGMNRLYRQIHDHYFYRRAAEAVVTFALNLFSYLYLIRLLLAEELTVSAFVLFIGLIGSFSAYFGLLMDQLISLHPFGISLGYIRHFLDLPDGPGWSEGIGAKRMEELKKAGISVAFRQVSYRYPKKEEATLRDVNLTIRPGEKLALIGLNGAGKTTLVKLLCGFYRPTEGEILLNGIPVGAFSREEYGELVSALFQDSALLPLTLEGNLTGQDSAQIDRARLRWALEMAGVWEKYDSLPKGGQTLMVREVDEEAVDVSGGEKQKLLFARALYKRAPLLILDEPTAALDPIAEQEMYVKFGEAAEGRTCLYISHRLSSTRFCDRILLMEHGRILEEGTHESLMEKGGRYARLFAVQSRYYRQQEERRAMMGDEMEPPSEGKGIFHE